MEASQFNGLFSLMKFNFQCTEFVCPAASGSDVGAHKDLGAWFGAAALGTSGKCSFIWADTCPGRRNRDPGDNSIPLMHSEEGSVLSVLSACLLQLELTLMA